MTTIGAQEIADLILVDYPKYVRVVGTTSRQPGWANYTRHTITMPQWPNRHGEEFATYIAIHEACHFLAIGHGHDATFKAIETKWMREFGLVPIYSRAYCTAIANLSGKVVWARTWKARDKYAVGDIVSVGEVR